ncbi:MAG: efflux RND transporter permease subunit [Schwartzia sp. (in: firmicutes)]
MRNLTEVSLKNRDLVWYAIAVVFVAGIFSYLKLGRMEDPSFTIRQMVVTAAWPGATAAEMEQQVTDKLERKFQDIPRIDYIRSYSRPGQTVIFVNLRDDVPAAEIRNVWRDVRNFGADIKAKLPEGVYGPFYNDRFDDVYGSVYAVTGEGYTYEELRQTAEKLRRLILDLPAVQKVELLGDKTERVYIEMDKARLSALGLSPMTILEAIKAHNAVTPAAMVDTEENHVYLRVSGSYDDLDAIRATPLSAGGRLFRLGDVAMVERRYAEPSDPEMYFDGARAVGVAVSMEDGGNVLALGEELRALIEKVQEEEPVGLSIHRVSDQPAVVADSIDAFVSALREAVVIVLAVSFLSLGVRTGLVVAGCIPLVLAGVFCAMYLLGIDLHKVSLGALIISLGLLVDDAIIAVEMMSVKLEEGLGRFDAACYAFRATAMPMLTGTLITVAGFIPVAFAVGSASEFCRDLFTVIAIALSLSWIVSVMVAPLFGYHLIRVPEKKNEQADPYQSRFYGMFRAVLGWVLTHRTLVLAGTAGIFLLSLFLLKSVRQEFFPPSLRPEILLDMRLPEGSSLKASEREAARLARFLDERKGEMENYAYYVGTGAPRFVLTINPRLPASNYSQFVIVAKSAAARDDLIAALRRELADNFPEVRTNMQTIQTGPPADYPVMIRAAGYDREKVRALAGEVADLMREDPNYVDVHFDWNEKSQVISLALDQDKMRALGLSSHDVAMTLYTEITGVSAAQYYRGDRTIDMVFRLREADRDTLEKVKELPIGLPSGRYVPLSQVAQISYQAEDGLIWRRDLKPTITVQANIKSGTADDAAKKIYEKTAALRASLPLGYTIEPGGTLEDSKKSMGYLIEPVPAMVLLIMTFLMVQLRNGKQMILTLLTAPLGLIGVAMGMLLFDKALGFVADLGILALTGMIIRNSVILIDQIQKHEAAGESPWNAVVDSAILRFRPIMLTAAAAILGMVPLMSSTFWGPMAVAIAAGLIVATVLTLLVLPAMYAAVYKVERE